MTSVEKERLYQLAQHFLKALKGDVPYLSNENREWEKFIEHWLIDMPIEEEIEKMSILYDVLQPEFPLRGVIYRGMQTEKGTVLQPKQFAGFSTDKEVAKFFAGYSPMYSGNQYREGDHWLLEVNVQEAFSLIEVLPILDKKTTSKNLQEAIMHNAWESEVISPLTEDMLRLLKAYTEPKKYGISW